MIAKGDFRPDTKHLGQHFLIDEQVADRLVALAQIEREEVVLEIGAGFGFLTCRLAERAEKVYTIEIDRRFHPWLEKLTQEAGNIEIIWGDALKVPFPRFDKFVASLPYQILEPLIEKLIRHSFDSALLVTGARFGFTVLQHPRAIKFKKLAVLVNCFFYPKIEFVVPSSSFNPKPRMSSTVVVLTPKKITDLLDDKVLYLFRQLFEQRDKKIKNGLREAIIRFAEVKGTLLTKNQARLLIEESGIPDQILDNRLESVSNTQLELLGHAFANIAI